MIWWKFIEISVSIVKEKRLELNILSLTLRKKRRKGIIQAKKIKGNNKAENQ